MKKNTEKVRVYAPNNFYISYDFFDGDIRELIKKLQDIPKQHKEFLKEFGRIYGDNKAVEVDPLWKSIDEYRIVSDRDWEGETSYSIEMYRNKTLDELIEEDRIRKKRSIVAKNAAKVRKEAQEKRERTLLETLKKKYESG